MGLDTADRPRSPQGTATAVAMVVLAAALIYISFTISLWFLLVAIPVATTAAFGVTLELGRQPRPRP